MNRDASPLLSVTLNRVARGWAQRLSIDVSPFLNPGITVIAKEESRSVVTVKFFDSIVLICPPALLHALSPLSPANAIDIDLLLLILDRHEPTPVGIATIAYADEATLQAPSTTGTTHVANRQEVEEVLSSCAHNEQEESGVAGLEVLFVAKTDDGTSGAVAGYRAWNKDIAQLGVLTKPKQRGKGLATTAAYAAARAAQEADLIPQWRSRVGNVASYRLSQQLGFHDVGFQLAIDVVLSTA